MVLNWYMNETGVFHRMVPNYALLLMKTWMHEEEKEKVTVVFSTNATLFRKCPVHNKAKKPSLHKGNGSMDYFGDGQTKCAGNGLTQSFSANNDLNQQTSATSNR